MIENLRVDIEPHPMEPSAENTNSKNACAYRLISLTIAAPTVPFRSTKQPPLYYVKIARNNFFMAPRGQGKN
jgi:hypothetical protein